MLARARGSGREEPSRRALAMESPRLPGRRWDPEGPRRQLGVERMWKDRGGSGSGGSDRCRWGSGGIRKPGFSRIAARLAPSWCVVCGVGCVVCSV